MKTRNQNAGLMLSLAATLFCSIALTGCQTSIGGQTLPSATYLDDDVQYFPAGPEFKLSNQVKAAQRYKLEQEQIRGGL